MPYSITVVSRFALLECFVKGERDEAFIFTNERNVYINTEVVYSRRQNFRPDKVRDILDFSREN